MQRSLGKIVVDLIRDLSSWTPPWALSHKLSPVTAMTADKRNPRKRHVRWALSICMRLRQLWAGTQLILIGPLISILCNSVRRLSGRPITFFSAFRNDGNEIVMTPMSTVLSMLCLPTGRLLVNEWNEMALN
ncbi:hypothetical protein KQX54_020134 [Cotesia glomerata]|uniref:Uncharacterized protein n=1 Tax=Cotesia glomerata TaxID=32391 RepID=A0AAV7IH76_COTGL|nr:hypothetical protein KQX54_020134 [Cotesia glomerata]